VTTVTTSPGRKSDRFQVLDHPSHYRSTLQLLLPTLGLAALSFAVGLAIQTWRLADAQLPPILGGLFGAFTLAGLAIAIARHRHTRCPRCGSMLRLSDQDERFSYYPCVVCEVTWRSRLRLVVEAD
jgi:hypothetical protein